MLDFCGRNARGDRQPLTDSRIRKVQVHFQESNLPQDYRGSMGMRDPPYVVSLWPDSHRPEQPHSTTQIPRHFGPEGWLSEVALRKLLKLGFVLGQLNLLPVNLL